MNRVAVVSLLVLGSGLAPSLAQSSQSDLERAVQELTRRVEALERRLAQPAQAPAKAAAPAQAPAATDTAREDALALYKRIDELVAAGKIEQANQELTSWNTARAGTPSASWTGSLGRELAVVGKAAPSDWAIDHWYQGQSEVKLDGRQPTLVVFWEAWCPHCRDEVPRIAQLWERYKRKGLQVLGVTRITQTATEESVKAFLAESKVAYPMAKETGDLATYFDVKGIPAAALVKDGKVVWRGHPIRLTDELLDIWF
jgi:thiol-disulfide isomerase/thioredoxin